MIYFTKPSGRVKQANPVFAPPRASNWLASLAVVGLFASPAYGQGVTNPNDCTTLDEGAEPVSGTGSVAQGCSANAGADDSVAVGAGAATANYRVPGDARPDTIAGRLTYAGSLGPAGNTVDYTAGAAVVIRTDDNGVRTGVFAEDDTDFENPLDLTGLTFSLARTVTPQAAIEGTGGAGAIAVGANSRTIGEGSISIGAGASVISFSTAAQAVTPPDAVTGTLMFAGSSNNIDYSTVKNIIVEVDPVTKIATYYAEGDINREFPIRIADSDGNPVSFTLTQTNTPAPVPPASQPQTVAVEGAIAIGAGASVTHLEDANGDAILDADGASTPAHRGVAIGNNAKVTGENGIAIGANAEAGANEIRIGTNQSEVFIGPYDLGQISDDVETNRAGIASAVALANLPSVQGPDGGWSLALGSFDGETAVAGGINFDFRQIGTIKIGVASSGGETSAGVGFGMGF